MPNVPPGNKPPGRRPSLNGILMQDVSQGKERVRAWPKKRPKRSRSKASLAREEWFRQAQWAAKYMAPQMLRTFMDATKGTPLLPRDIATMMFANRMFVIQKSDGKRLYPMPYSIDVSASLDALGQTPGMTLFRGTDLWRAELPSTPNAAGLRLTYTGTWKHSSTPGRENIPWSTAVINQAPCWSPSDPTKITADISGWYQCSFTAMNANDGSPAQGMTIQGPNGQQCALWADDVLNTRLLRRTVSGPIYMSAGEEMYCEIYDENNARDYTELAFNMVRF